MIGQIAFPGRWQNVSALEDQIYTQYEGPDTDANQSGMSDTQMLDWLTKQGIGHINMASLLNNMGNFQAEIQAQNRQSVCQILLVGDESKLVYAANGQKLHNWVDTGLAHIFLRVGYSDDQAYGLYFEPAAGLAFPKPVAIPWANIVEAGIEACIAVMPDHVDLPPAGFSYQTGTWPALQPAPIDRGGLIADLQLASSTIDAAALALGQVPATPFASIPDLLTKVQHTLATVQSAHQRIVSDLSKV